MPCDNILTAASDDTSLFSRSPAARRATYPARCCGRIHSQALPKLQTRVSGHMTERRSANLGRRSPLVPQPARHCPARRQHLLLSVLIRRLLLVQPPLARGFEATLTRLSGHHSDTQAMMMWQKYQHLNLWSPQAVSEEVPSAPVCRCVWCTTHHNCKSTFSWSGEGSGPNAASHSFLLFRDTERILPTHVRWIRSERK